MPPTSSSVKFSATNAISLCHEVQRLESLATPTVAEGARLETCLRDLVEVLVWCDKHDEAACDRALDCDIMTTVERIATNALTPMTLKVQALRFVTVLLQNLTRLSSVYFVCSNNHVNRVIAMQLDEQTDDDELVSTYTSFLKTLALRLDTATLQFFFDSSTPSFPLFDKASKLLMSPDTIIGAAARQVVVTIAQLSDASLAEYLKSSLMDVFRSICELLQQKLHLLGDRIPSLWKLQTKQRDAPPSSTAVGAKLNLRAVTGDVEDALDDVYYLNDLIAVTPPAMVNTVLRLVAQSLLRPMQGVLERELDRQECHGGGGAAACVEFLEPVAPETVVAFLARWLVACDAGSPLAACLVHVLVGSGDTRPRTGGTLGRILRAAVPELHGSALRLVHVAAERTLLSHWPASAVPAPVTVRAAILSGQEPIAVPQSDAVVVADLMAVLARSLPEASPLADDLEDLHWLIAALVASLRTLLTQPARARITTVAVVLRELDLVLSRTLCRDGQTEAQQHAARDVMELLWQSLLVSSQKALVRPDGGAVSAVDSSVAPVVEQTAGETMAEETDCWLGPAHSAGSHLAEVYLLAKREDARVGAALADLLTDDALVSRHDATWFVPALPQYRLCEVSIGASASPPLTLDAWRALRASLTEAVALVDRVPLTAAEERSGCARAWLLVRAFLALHVDEPSSAALLHEAATTAESAPSPRALVLRRDPFPAHCARTSSSVAPLHALSLADMALGPVRIGGRPAPSHTPGLHCELIAERYTASTRLHMASPGTAMQLVWGENETLYLVKSAPDGGGEAALQSRTVLFALDTDFVEAAVCPSAPFKVVMGFNPPRASEAAEIYVVLRHRTTAAEVVQHLSSVVAAHRRAGAELMAVLCGVA